MKRKLFLFIPVLIVANWSFTQTQHSAYTAIGKGVATTFLTDYQAIGINASALGWGTGYEGKHFTLGTSEFAFGISSPALDKERLGNAASAIYNTIRDRENTDFDLDKQREAAADYASSGIAINADYNWFGASYQSEKIGGIGVAVREKYNWYSNLNEETTDIIFRGKLASYFDSLTIAIDGDTSQIANSSNLSQDTLAAVIRGTVNDPLSLSKITEGSEIKFSWNREYNIGYGRKIFGDDSTFALYGGVGARYIQSVAMFDLESNEDGLSMRSAVSPFYDIDYGDIALTNPTSITENAGLLPKASGTGYGVDVAASIILLKNIKIAAAVNNIGSVTYNRNVYSVRDTLVGSMTLPGLADYDVTEAMSQLLQDGSILNLVAEEEHVVMNPATFRVGGSIEFFDKFDVGVDIIAPFNNSTPGSLQNAVVSVGGDFKPFEWLHLSAGYFGGGVYSHNVPVGVNFVIGGGAYEFGIASRDALSFFLQDSRSLSGAFGFARVRF